MYSVLQKLLVISLVSLLPWHNAFASDPGVPFPRLTFWVGSHKSETGERGDFVHYVVDWHLSAFTNRFKDDKSVHHYLSTHNARVDLGITLHAAARRGHYRLPSNAALAVMSGIVNKENMFSQVYLGPLSPTFSVSAAKVFLDPPTVYNVSDLYDTPFIEIVISYAIIREAIQQGKSFASLVFPLREHTQDAIKDLLKSVTSKGAAYDGPLNPSLLQQMYKDLENLVETGKGKEK